MTTKQILNGLTLSLMLTLIPTPAHAGWLSTASSSISSYFNQPSKNALIATTALAGISLLATGILGWYSWHTKKENDTNKTLSSKKDTLALACDAYKKQIETSFKERAKLEQTLTLAQETAKEKLKEWQQKNNKLRAEKEEGFEMFRRIIRKQIKKIKILEEATHEPQTSR